MPIQISGIHQNIIPIGRLVLRSSSSCFFGVTMFNYRKLFFHNNHQLLVSFGYGKRTKSRRVILSRNVGYLYTKYRNGNT